MSVEYFLGSLGLSHPAVLTARQPRVGSGSGAGLPGFKSQLCHLPAGRLRQVPYLMYLHTSVPWFSHLDKGLSMVPASLSRTC